MPPVTALSQLDLSKSYTYADYLTWQLGEWVELIKGRVRHMGPAPQTTRQTISFNLSTIVGSALRGSQCRGFAAPFDVRLNTSEANGDAQISTVVQPTSAWCVTRPKSTGAAASAPPTGLSKS